MKKITVILSLLLCLLILCSCGGTQEPETTLTAETTTEATATETTAEQVTSTEPVTQSESEKALGEFRRLMKDENYLCGVAYTKHELTDEKGGQTYRFVKWRSRYRKIWRTICSFTKPAS